MRSTRTWRGWAVGWLWAAAVALAVLGAAPVHAERAALPSAIPEGYTFDPDGAVRWMYPTAAESEVEDLKQTLREAWPRVSAELGYHGAGELDIRIGVNPEQMQALAPPGARLPAYASGVALPAQGLILLTFTAPSTWLRPDMDRVLTHELSHVALYRALDGHEVPRWFAEGLAIHQAGEHSIERTRTLWEGTLRGQLIPLSQLSASFPAVHGEVSVAYAQSADLVRHLLSSPGDPQRMRALLSAVASGTPFERALEQAYDLPLWQLEREWRNALTRRFGRWPSVLMGLTVVWVIGAVLLVIGYVRTRRRHKRTLRRWAIEEAPLWSTPANAASTPPPPPVPNEEPRPVQWDEARQDSGVPTVMHDGRSHTLH